MTREESTREAEWVRLLEAACPAATPRPGAEERVLERVRQRRDEVTRRSARSTRAVVWATVAVACAFCLGISLAYSMRASDTASTARTSSGATGGAPLPQAIEPRSQPADLAPPLLRRVAATVRDELVELDRGARVLARAGTSIELSETAQVVECRLVFGEVLVHVPEGSRGTFAVVTSTQRVEVTGTVFGVSASATGKTSVSVWDGRVEVLDGAASASLVAGESWPRGAEALRADAADMAQLAASARLAHELAPNPQARGEQKKGKAAAEVSAPSRARGAKGGGLHDVQYARARRLEAEGDRARAAGLYERVAEGDGPTAEAAAFAAARLYGGLSDHAGVRRVLSSYRARHPSGLYARASDVLWLRSLVAEHDSAGIEREAERFLRNHPDDPRAPQFRGARALDRARRGRCVEARFDLAEVEAATRAQIDLLCDAPPASSR